MAAASQRQPADGEGGQAERQLAAAFDQRQAETDLAAETELGGEQDHGGVLHAEAAGNGERDGARGLAEAFENQRVAGIGGRREEGGGGADLPRAGEPARQTPQRGARQ